MTDAVSQMEPTDDVYKTLLESTKAIPWKIDWSSMTFAYIGPQIEELLGWEPSSWVSAEDWAVRMHPDDRERVQPDPGATDSPRHLRGRSLPEHQSRRRHHHSTQGR